MSDDKKPRPTAPGEPGGCWPLLTLTFIALATIVAFLVWWI